MAWNGDERMKAMLPRLSYVRLQPGKRDQVTKQQSAQKDLLFIKQDPFFADCYVIESTILLKACEENNDQESWILYKRGRDIFL
jgi:hypothetical protein